MNSNLIYDLRRDLEEEEAGVELTNFITDADIAEIIIEYGPHREAVLAEMKETAIYKKIAAGDVGIPETRLHTCCRTRLWKAATRISDEHGTKYGITSLFNQLVAVAEKNIKNELE